MKLGVIVEGEGEVATAPVLLRRLAIAAGVQTPIEIPPPFRLTRGKMLKEDELRRAVELIARKTAPDGALLILLDADDDCPAELASRVRAWAAAQRADRRVSVVLPQREFEGWFLAAAASLRGVRGLPADLEPPASPETVRDAKGWLGLRMPGGYSPSIDQAAMAACIDLEVAAASARSFDKLRRDVWALVSAPQTRT